MFTRDVGQRGQRRDDFLYILGTHVLGHFRRLAFAQREQQDRGAFGTAGVSCVAHQPFSAPIQDFTTCATRLGSSPPALRASCNFWSYGDGPAACSDRWSSASRYVARTRKRVGEGKRV